MTSSEATRIWRKAVKELFDCTCVYCGKTYDLHELTLDHVRPPLLEERRLQATSYQRVPVVIKEKVVMSGRDG
jgi:5-methylcytosine-specific restriction endonuclease McrA